MNKNVKRTKENYSMISLSIIIPVFNEEKTILQLLKLVKSESIPGISFEIIVINDGSRDSSLKILKKNKKYYDKLIDRQSSGGKGAAVLDGIISSTSEYILFQDADLEYDPKDYKNLIEPVKRFKADLVIGSRFLAPKIIRTSYFLNQIGNIVITNLFNLFYNTSFTDIYSCYVLFKKEKLDQKKIKTNGWEQQAEILSNIVLNSKLHFEVPISYYGRTYEEGKKIRPYHIFKILYIIVIKRFLRK